jgi:small subunit ribosomal protein S3Ae
VTVVCLTLTRAEQSQIHAIRQTVTQSLLARAAESDFESLVKDIMSGDLARDVFKIAKTIYPIRRVEIIKSKLERIAAV